MDQLPIVESDTVREKDIPGKIPVCARTAFQDASY